MNLFASFKTVGLILLIYSLSFLPPIIISLYFGDQCLVSFISCFFITAIIGFVLWLCFKTSKFIFFFKEGFFIVVFSWLLIGIVSALPFYALGFPKINYASAFFESISGLTATGATALINLEYLPISLLYYRQQLQFIGGMGIIVLVIGILPALGVQGLKLLKTELSGSALQFKTLPRIAKTAGFIWLIYLSMTIVCIVCYWASGMTILDAVQYSFATVSTGGFSPYDNNFGHYNIYSIKIIAMIFMLLGSINFNLHFLVIFNSSLKYYFLDPEFKFFSAMILGAFLIIMLAISNTSFNITFMLDKLFHIISFATTTGFTLENISKFPLFLPSILLLLGIIGGCSNSTSGGIKIIRVLSIIKVCKMEILSLIYPKAAINYNIGNLDLSNRAIIGIFGYMSFYVFILIISSLSLMYCDLDITTAFSASMSALSNTGPGLGSVADDYHNLSSSAKIIISFDMLAGRIELLPLIILGSPSYWKQ